MITENQDYVGRYKIPNATDTSPNSDLLGNSVELQLFIDQFEEECLILVLGYTLYQELLTQLDPAEDNDLVAGADQKWDDLLNGKETYRGLREIIISYVFFYFLENDESEYSGVGVVKEYGKGSRSFTSRPKAVKAWRQFRLLAQGQSGYPEVFTRGLIGGTSSGIGVVWTDYDEKRMPLYAFLSENNDTYPTAVTSPIGNMNYYGI